ncbi:hypothetical protein BC938DRAFT_475464 [Jimgerdemannia flammicorona]|uniref:Uncharacterized protein n=1 Tax=Jimgerdemannia flammicorona TaxID=994334 RepID=A0A433QRL4_9FUNG|nr:hypothetical protein BC938DRAFT_475464 [Jimgerdemannia flammicorona]
MATWVPQVWLFQPPNYMRICGEMHLTHLHYAVQNNNFENILKRLKNRKPYANMMDKDDQKSLHLVAGKGYTEMPKLLLEDGGSVSEVSGQDLGILGLGEGSLFPWGQSSNTSGNVEEGGDKGGLSKPEEIDSTLSD